MAHTTSIMFPEMINISQNCLNVAEDNIAIVNRTRLLMLSDPTSLHYVPQFGLGLRKHIWKYNLENEKQIIRDELVRQLEIYEPYVIPDETQYANGLLFTGDSDTKMYSDFQEVNMTISMNTTYSDTIEVTVNSEGDT